MMLWYVYFTYYNDFPKAYEYILRAEEIEKELDERYSLVYMNMGVFYHFLSNLNNDVSLKREAMINYKRALNLSAELKSRIIVNYSFSNILLLLIDRFEDVTEEWEIYKNLSPKLRDSTYSFNIKAYQALSLSHNGNHEEAIRMLEKIIVPKAVINDDSYGRFKFVLDLLSAKLYENSGDLHKAIEIMKDAENVSTQYEIRENRLEAYLKISNYYKKLNRTNEYKEYNSKYLALKDSLMGYGYMSSISRMKFVRKMDKMNNEIKDIKQEREIQNMFFVLFFIVLVAITVTSLILYLKNKQLSKKNTALFYKYSDLCKIEEQLRNNSKKVETAETEVSNNEDKQKYVTSVLQDDEKSELLDKVLTVMENVEEICSPDFSTDRLAELTGTKYKYVSQVINEKYGCTFYALLNKYRVKEVCRRFADVEKYGNYTTEAISESVGFKSRATFINAFKKETGMTPFQYLKIAQNENKK